MGKEKFEARDPFLDFVEEMRLIQKEEERERKTAHFHNYPDFDPTKLTPYDMDMWNRVKNETITREDLKRFGEQLKEDAKRDPDAALTHRVFFAFLNNKGGVIIGQRELAKSQRRPKKPKP